MHINSHVLSCMHVHVRIWVECVGNHLQCVYTVTCTDADVHKSICINFVGVWDYRGEERDKRCISTFRNHNMRGSSISCLKVLQTFGD